MSYDKRISDEVFSSVLAEVDINTFKLPTEECFHPPLLFDLDKAKLAYHQNQGAFLNAYKTAVASFLEVTKNDDSPNVAQHSCVLLKLVDINVAFGLDSRLLADLLIVLSNKIALLETRYGSHIYGDYFWGTRVALNLTLTVDGILTREPSDAELNLTKNMVVDAVSQMPVTNTTLAGWNEFVLKHYRMRPAKKVTQAMKACWLCDRLVGSGVRDLLLNNAQEKVAKKLKPFNDVGLEEVSQKILAFYACQTGNEKRRFLSDIEKEFSSADIIGGINRFLREG